MKKSTENQYFEATGRRKTSTARVRLYEVAGASTINDIAVEKYFVQKTHQVNVMKPFIVAGLLDKISFTATVNGGGLTGQLDAITLGMARALIKLNPELKTELRAAGFITRDPRMVERKKYELKKARKKPQFSKR